MYWIDGSSYKGQWERGAQKGEGIMTYADGTVKKIVETTTSRNFSIGNNNDMYNSKSFSQSDKKLPKHQRLISDASSYSQDEMNPDSFLHKSANKHKVKIKLINHNNMHSTSNERFNLNKIHETARESSSRQYNNFMRITEGHRRVHSKHEFPKIPPINKIFNQEPSNADYDSAIESHGYTKKSPPNKVLASSHYSIQPRNRSFDLRKESRIQTGNKSSAGHMFHKLYARHNLSHDITTEPEAVIKIIKRNRNKKKQQMKKGQNFRIRSNSHNTNALANKFSKQTRNIYHGIMNSIKKKKNPWRPNGVKGAIFHNQ